MKRVTAPEYRTAAYVLSHGGWRALVTVVVTVAPFYGWIQFYYLSTGAWNQPIEQVVGNPPLLATFFIPLIIAAWVIGFQGRYIFVGAIAGAIIAGWTPPASLAAQLFPYGYINLGITLVLLMISWRAFCYWRDYNVHKLPVARYTNGARTVAAIAVVFLLILLLPIQI